VNDEAGHHARPAQHLTATTGSVPRRLVITRTRQLLGAVVTLREAVAYGEPRLVVETWLAYLEADAADLVDYLERPDRRGRVCGTCGARFDWPGQLDQHLRNVHGSLEDAA
jgi:hypothetical protein